MNTGMKMKFKISNILIFAVLLAAFVLAGIGCAGALPPDEEWSRTYGESNIEEISFVRQTSDGGLVLAGNKETEIGINKGIDFWLMKLGEKSPESLEISNQSQVVLAQTTNVPGFEVLFSIGNLLVVTCLVLRMKRK